MKRKRLAIMGSTGSIGRCVVDIVRKNPEDFEITGLSCYENITELAGHIKEFGVKHVCVSTKSKANDLISLLSVKEPVRLDDLNICVGPEGLLELLSDNIDLAVNCLPGMFGVEVTKYALKHGIDVALANKEALVAEGSEIMKLAEENDAKILPIDSEMCAIAYCLQGRSIEDVKKVVLTCYGGPFLGKKRRELYDVTLEDALRHPTWPNMGQKISIDSATLMNKGFEVIEASYLFGLPPEKIEIVIHPQSLVHGIVYFKDGNVLMHAASPDMRIPISHCLYAPEVKESPFEILDLVKAKKLEFFEPDTETFTNIPAAYNALRTGTTKQLLEDNDSRVEKFLAGEIQFIELFQ
ncbi:1-deoxy-D-xylulose-5-phosphate reductoisomerase [Candidatus Peregrinibacteria bacterium]|nr:1-deoxy-D-xylulose-5-phosphate reductoisomerase [Candidatus Peregrinibacteria bacterium]